MKYSDKKIIQDYVYDTCDGDEEHRTFAIAHSAKNGAYNIVCCDERYTDKANGQVSDRVVQRLIRSGHGGNYGMEQ